MKKDLLSTAWRTFWLQARTLMGKCSRDELVRLAQAARMFAAECEHLAAEDLTR